MKPPTNASVLSMVKKIQIQKPEHAQPLRCFACGQEEKRTHDFKLHDATNLSASLDIMRGAPSAKWHKSKQFVPFLNLIAGAKPHTWQTHVSIDNRPIHKAGRLGYGVKSFRATTSISPP